MTGTGRTERRTRFLVGPGKDRAENDRYEPEMTEMRTGFSVEPGMTGTGRTERRTRFLVEPGMTGPGAGEEDGITGRAGE